MKNLNKKILTLTLLLLIIPSITFAGNNLEVHFLDVGQADSILVKLPTNQTMLIDAGNNADGDFVVDYIKSQGIKKIDFLIGTHPHEDHIGGLDNVIETLEIGQIFMPRVTHTTKTYEDLLIAIKAKGKKIKPARTGKPPIETKKNMEIYFLSPGRDHYEELNHYSAVVKLTYKNTSFLFTGDAEEINEFDMLLSSSTQPAVDVLKLGHHGSHSSTSEAFLEAVSPEYAVITVGKDNDYGHPSPIVLNRLQKNNVKVYRTDRQGTVIAVSDGENITFNTEPVEITNREVASSLGIIITSVDLRDELVVIKNKTNKDIDISDWQLLSVRGEQSFYFPSGTILKPGETIKIDTGPGATSGKDQLKWTSSYIWNNDGDPAELYDEEGNLISSYGY